MQKICTEFHCEKCDYTCSRKFLWNQHIKTKKHNGNIWKHLETKNMHICPCGKTYKTRGGFSKHKKKCTYTVVKEEIVIDEDKSNVEELLHELIEDNKTLRSEIKNLKLGTTYNQNLSINLFLNDKCKDAMTLTDFVENLHLSLKDLDFTNTQGYVEGISKIFIKNLNNMDVTERPIHCSDQKRLQFYVKKENKWEKDAEHEEIDKSIAKVSKKQILILTDWCKEIKKAGENFLMKLQGGVGSGSATSNCFRWQLRLFPSDRPEGLFQTCSVLPEVTVSAWLHPSYLHN